MHRIRRPSFPSIAVCAAIAVAFGSGILLRAAAAADAAVADAPAIEPGEAAKHVGEKCVVTMTVASSRLMADEGRCYLNSCKSFRDRENLSVVIFRPGLEKFAAAEIADPAEHFRDKTIRVTGTIELFKDRPQIKVNDPDQVELVPEAGDATAER